MGQITLSNAISHYQSQTSINSIHKLMQEPVKPSILTNIGKISCSGNQSAQVIHVYIIVQNMAQVIHIYIIVQNITNTMPTNSKSTKNYFWTCASFPITAAASRILCCIENQLLWTPDFHHFKNWITGICVLAIWGKHV